LLQDGRTSIIGRSYLLEIRKATV